jgi:ribosome-associated protein
VSADPDPVTEVPIREIGIRLGQFLKLAGAVDSGADVKGLLADGAVTVNDQPESRRGRQLVRGDVISLAGQRWRVG